MGIFVVAAAGNDGLCINENWIDEEIKKPLSKMMLFGELTEGGMVEVGLSDDVVPKLTVNFKAKKERKAISVLNPADEKTS